MNGVTAWWNRNFPRLVVDVPDSRVTPCPSCRQIPPLSQDPVAPGQIDFSKLTHITLSRKADQRASSLDFVMRLTPQTNTQPGSRPLDFLLDTWRSVSFVYAWDGSRGFYASYPRNDAGCFDYDPIGRICNYVSETMNAGHALLTTPQVWLTNSRFPNVDGVIGANRLGPNFQRDFLTFPDTSSSMKLVFNPPDLGSLICRTPFTRIPLTADAYSKGTWQVRGRIGCNGMAAEGEVVLTTAPSPIELERRVFSVFRQMMRSANMHYHEGFGAYRVSDCRRYRERFPRITVDLGGFHAHILPQDYTYFSSRVSGCLIDVQESQNGIMQLGPAFLRNVVTWFRPDSVDICERV
jgi:hypothetical protein